MELVHGVQSLFLLSKLCEYRHGNEAHSYTACFVAPSAAIAEGASPQNMGNPNKTTANTCKTSCQMQGLCHLQASQRRNLRAPHPILKNWANRSNVQWPIKARNSLLHGQLNEFCERKSWMATACMNHTTKAFKGAVMHKSKATTELKTLDFPPKATLAQYSFSNGSKIEIIPHSLPSADLAFSSQMLTLFLRWASSSVKQIGKFWQVSLPEEALTSSNKNSLLAKMKSKETAATKQGSNGVRPCLSAMFLEAPASKNATIWESKPKDISSCHQINNSPKHASTSFVAAGPLSQASLAMNA